MPIDEDVLRRARRPVCGGETNPCAGCVAPNCEGLGRDASESSRSCSSARRRVSRRSFSERDGGRGMGGRACGSCVAMLSGDEGLEREREFDVIFVDGDMG